MDYYLRELFMTFLCWKLLLKLKGGQMDIDNKCLYLGIDDYCKQDVVTTYNSPKRVLHSLEESLLRIALESEDDLLCTCASPSPLPPLSSGFWSHMSPLNKLNASDGSFKLSGYISGPEIQFTSLI